MSKANQVKKAKKKATVKAASEAGIPLNDRIRTLEDISGMTVLIRKEKGDNVFMFFFGERPSESIKDVFTYPKAKLFADGIELGRKLGAGMVAVAMLPIIPVPPR